MGGFIRRKRWLVVPVLAVLLIGVLSLLLPRPFFSGQSATVQAEGARRILLLSNPIHTDIAIPLDAETRARFGFVAKSGLPLDHPQARFLIIGWGGRAFYIETPTWADLKPVPLIKGLTLDRSVLHVAVAGDIAEKQDVVEGFDLPAQGYERLLAFIEASFAETPQAALAIPDAGYGPNDRFYEAKGWFNALFGCNNWTARALREAGLRTAWWTPLPAALRASLAVYNE